MDIELLAKHPVILKFIFFVILKKSKAKNTFY